MKTTVFVLMAEMLVLISFILGLYSLIRKDFKLFRRHVVQYERENGIRCKTLPVSHKKDVLSQ